MPADPSVRQAVAGKLLDFWTFYREHAGAARTGLSVRDLLAWVGRHLCCMPSFDGLSALVHDSLVEVVV